jgi:ABC-type transport system involved in multi-copper enzyme maturation permease subunit
MTDAFLRDLQQPEYLHVLLNPIPLYGLAFALFGLIAATYLRSRGGQLAALVLVFASAIFVWPVVRQGDLAYNPVLSMADENGQAWLKAHVHRADQLIWLYYTLAALAAGAIFVPKKWPKTALPLVIVTMVLALVSLGAGAYIAHAGGKIRHREFRNVPPPKTDVEPR